MNLDSLLINNQALEDQSEEFRAHLEGLYKKIGRTAGDLRRVLMGTPCDDAGLHDALSAARGQLVEMLRFEGVVVFGTEGEELNPAQHVVVRTTGEPSSPRQVLQVECEGLAWEGRVIQKAEVTSTPIRLVSPVL